MLEDALRGLFTERAEPVPATDAADRVIRRGRAIRRRQMAAASAAAAAFVVAVAGIVSMGSRQGEEWHRANPVAPFDLTAEPSEPTGPTASAVASADPQEPDPRLDLVQDNQLWTADGRRLTLAGAGAVTRIYRVPSGWVYGSGAQLRLLRTDGSSSVLLPTAHHWIVSPDGHRVAAVIGNALRVGRIDDAGLVIQATTAVPTGSAPVVFTGDRIVVSGPSSSGYAVVDPARRAQPAWNRDVVAVFGQHGSSLVGLVRGGGNTAPCLAAFRVAPRLPLARATTCGLSATNLTAASLAPAGAWLAAADPTGVSIIDVARATAGRPSVTRCAVRPSIPVAWAGRSIVTADQRGLVRCRTDGRQEPVPMPPGVPGGWHLVPVLAATATADGAGPTANVAPTPAASVVPAPTARSGSAPTT